LIIGVASGLRPLNEPAKRYDLDVLGGAPKGVDRLSIDAVTAGIACHYFNLDFSKVSFLRPHAYGGHGFDFGGEAVFESAGIC
jgi:hypothetical protein